jgi:hypothetical protein
MVGLCWGSYLLSCMMYTLAPSFRQPGFMLLGGVKPDSILAAKKISKQINIADR